MRECACTVGPMRACWTCFQLPSSRCVVCAGELTTSLCGPPPAPPPPPAAVPAEVAADLAALDPAFFDEVEELKYRCVHGRAQQLTCTHTPPVLVLLLAPCCRYVSTARECAALRHCLFAATGGAAGGPLPSAADLPEFAVGSSVVARVTGGVHAGRRLLGAREQLAATGSLPSAASVLPPREAAPWLRDG